MKKIFNRTSLCRKSPYLEVLWSVFFCIWTNIYRVNQLRIRAHFTQLIVCATSWISFTGAKYFDPCGLDTPYGHPFLPQRKVTTLQDVPDEVFQIMNRDQGNRKKVSHIYMTFSQFIDHDLVYMLFDREDCENTR